MTRPTTSERVTANDALSWVGDRQADDLLWLYSNLRDI